MVDVDDQVRLLIPADAGFLRLARLTAAAVASRMSFTFDEVEDLRIAVDELAYHVIGRREPTGTLSLVVTIRDGAIEVEGAGSWPGEGEAAPVPELPELMRRILDAVVDEYRCEGTAAAPRFWLRKRKAGI